MNKPLMVVDENIPLTKDLFGDHFNLICKSGRSITHRDLKNAKALLVRSVTRVDKALLENTAIAMVGSCTIGLDHIDTEYLQRHKIPCFNAPGSNANGVVDYVLGALLTMGLSKSEDWKKRDIGIVGVGSVGGNLARRLLSLGVKVVGCDPWRQDVSGLEYVPWEELLSCSNVISFHVPFIPKGKHATAQMLSEQVIKKLSSNTWIINTSRGQVIDQSALMAALSSQDGKDGYEWLLALDVWEQEPQVPLGLLDRCLVATPHIAGYSQEGRLRAVLHVQQSMLEHMGLGLDAQVISSETLSRECLNSAMAMALASATVKKYGGNSEANVSKMCMGGPWANHQIERILLEALVSVNQDTRQFKACQKGHEKERATAFDAMRKHYRIRNELISTQYMMPEGLGLKHLKHLIGMR